MASDDLHDGNTPDNNSLELLSFDRIVNIKFFILHKKLLKSLV